MALPPILLPQHNAVEFRILRGTTPNRICFATVHKNALKPNSPVYAEKQPYNFGVPFNHGVVFEFFKSTGIRLRQNGAAYWTGLTLEQSEVVKNWIASQGTRVFLKDFFDCSVALGERSVDFVETELGALFHSAKYNQDEAAVAEISRRLRKTIETMANFEGALLLSCPPPRLGKEWDLPTELATRVARKLGVEFLSLGEWQNDKGQLKDVPADKKWAILANAGFRVNPKLRSGDKRVVLIDDIYQSGATLNFLRSSLTAAGVARASAISIVKAQRDSDNQ